MNDSTWTWIAGSASTYKRGVYGKLGIPDTANMPGARYTPTAWYSSATQTFWLFGGVSDGFSSTFYRIFRFFQNSLDAVRQSLRTICGNIKLMMECGRGLAVQNHPVTMDGMVRGMLPALKTYQVLVLVQQVGMIAMRVSCGCLVELDMITWGGEVRE